MQWFIGLISLWLLCGSQEGSETLRKTCWAPPNPRGIRQLYQQEDLYPLCPWIFTKLRTGETVMDVRESMGQWRMDPLSGVLWTACHSSQPWNCLGKHVGALQMLPRGELGILIQWDWLPWTILSSGPVWESECGQFWCCLSGSQQLHSELCSGLGKRWTDLSYFSLTSENGWISTSTHVSCLHLQHRVGHIIGSQLIFFESIKNHPFFGNTGNFSSPETWKGWGK